MFTALACGAVFFPGLFFSFRRVLTSTFAHWTDADVVAVSERDVMTDRHWLVNVFVLFGTPYMAHDIYAMYLSHYHNQRVRGHDGAYGGHSLRAVKAFLQKEWMLVIHHLVLLLIFMPISLFFRRGLGDFFIGCLFTTEFSTPFISIGKILIQLGLNDSRLHRINGIMVLVSFLICRILLFPFMYWMYGRQYGIPLHRVAFHLPLQCNVGNLAILAPQVYWFILLLRKARRLYLTQKTGKGNRTKTE